MVKGMKELVIGFMLVGLFMFAMIQFATRTQSDNNPNQNIIDDESMSAFNNSYESTRSAAEIDANSSRTSLEQDPEETRVGDVFFNSVRNVGKAFGGTASSFYNLLFKPLFSRLGVSPIVLGVIGTILLTLISFFIWKLYRTGQ